MIHLFDNFRDITIVSVLLRMILVMICGAVIGLERSYKNRPAGFRTHILVCIAAATASLVGIYLYVDLKLPADISRVGAQVITGLGFLGGGTIIVTKDEKVKGLTTAAGLWASGIIGLAIGAGFYEGGILATLLIYLSETRFSKLTDRLRRSVEFKIIVHYKEKPALNDVIRSLKNDNIIITNLQITSFDHGDHFIYSALIDVKSQKIIDGEEVIDKLKDIDGIMECEVM